MQINDGGPAFPKARMLMYKDGSGEMETGGDGMSLRDYFAAMAMQGILSNNLWNTFGYYDLAIEAFRQADEMIERRSSDALAHK